MNANDTKTYSCKDITARIFECGELTDLKLAKRLRASCFCRKNDLFLIRRDNRLLPCGGDLAYAAPEGGFDDILDAKDWIRHRITSDTALSTAKLVNADLPKYALQRFETYCEKKKLENAISNYSFFTDAIFTYSSSNSVLKADVRPELVGPLPEDCRYFFVERFNKYFATPRGISLDLSPQCVKRCAKCGYHSPISPYRQRIPSKKAMDLTLALDIIDQAAKMQTKPVIFPAYSGEPLLYHHLRQVLQHAQKKGVAISLTTNAMLLDKDNINLLLETGVDFILCSIDAVSEQVYSQIQAPGDLARVRRNVLRLLEMRKGAYAPSVGVHFVMGPENEYEFPAYLNEWINRVDYVQRAIRQDNFTTNKCVLPHFSHPGKRLPCFSAWNTMYVRYNGNITFCGLGFTKEGMPYMNLKDKTVEEAWNSDEFWTVRKAQLSNQLKHLPCKACKDWSCIKSWTEVRDGVSIVWTPLTEQYRKV